MFPKQPEFKYFKNLDGLRFLAAFAVIIGHCQDIIKQKGYIAYDPFANKLANFGVDFFFVLSGFLISYLLLREIDLTGKINIKYFYFRRFLRIWPVYFAFGLLGLATGKFFIDWFNYHPEYSHDYSIKDFFYNVFFLGTFSINFQTMFGFHRPVSSLMVSHFWSLGIEEQFYLLWAPCMFFFRKKTWVLIFIFTLIGWYFNTIPFEKVSQYESFHINFTINRFFHFGLGAGLAWIIRYVPLVQIRDFLLKWIKRYTPPSSRGRLSVLTAKSVISTILKPENVLNGFLLIIQSLFLTYISIYLLGNHYPLKERLINGWVSVGIITMAIMPISILTFFLLETRAFKYLGRISFGIYIYHLISIHLIDKLLETLGNTPLQTSYYYLLPFLSTTLAVAAAAASYEYFEKYFLTLKTKFHIG